MKFLDQEWFEKHVEALKKEFSEPNRSNVTLVEVYENVYGEDGKSVWIHYVQENGLLKSCERGEGEDDIPEAQFVVYGDYADYVAVCEGRLEPSKGIVSGKFTLEGNLLKAMGMLGTYNRITECKKLEGTEF